MFIYMNKKRKLATTALVILLVGLVFIPTANIIALKGKEEKKEEIEKIEHPKEVVYVVKSGDSLYRIADKYNVHLYQIREWNGLGNSSFLHPGDEIIVKHVEYDAYEGLASWYGPNFHGKNMANGEVYDMNKIIVAHRTLPLGTKVRVTNLDNGKSIIAPVLDRGPYVKDGQGNYTREIDLSYGVALALGTIQKGVVPARIEPMNEPLPLN
jgi:rare lipoprotein A